MNIGHRLTVAFAGVGFVITCGAAVASWLFLGILQQSRTLASIDDKVMAVYRIRADVGAIRRRLDDTSKAGDMTHFAGQVRTLRSESFEDIQKAQQYFHETATPVPGTLSALRDAMADQLDALQRLAEVNDWKAVQLRLDNQVDSILDRVRNMVAQVDSDVNEQRARTLREIEAAQRRAQIILGLTAFASLVVSLLLGLKVTRSIVVPLSELESAAHQLARGDFRVAVETGSKDELGEVARAFAFATEQLRDYYAALKRSNEDLEQFAYAASHDLQEPLRTISSFSELLKLRHIDGLPPEGKQHLCYIVEAAAHMRELIAGILEYSRLASWVDEKANEPVETEEILAAALKNLKAVIDQTRAEVTHDTLPRVVGSRLQLIQLFQNLIGNAIKYRREDTPPRIHLFAREDQGMWRFSVEDNGIGIAPEHHAQIFGIFKQLAHGSRGGVGVGLAISKRIVERHGGGISVKSSAGNGSCFSFSLKPAPDIQPGR